MVSVVKVLRGCDFVLIGRSDDLGFQLALPYPRGGEAVSLKASSVRDCQRTSALFLSVIPIH